MSGANERFDQMAFSVIRLESFDRRKRFTVLNFNTFFSSRLLPTTWHFFPLFSLHKAYLDVYDKIRMISIKWVSSYFLFSLCQMEFRKKSATVGPKNFFERQPHRGVICQINETDQNVFMIINYKIVLKWTRKRIFIGQHQWNASKILCFFVFYFVWCRPKMVN